MEESSVEKIGQTHLLRTSAPRTDAAPDRCPGGAFVGHRQPFLLRLDTWVIMDAIENNCQQRLRLSALTATSSYIIFIHCSRPCVHTSYRWGSSSCYPSTIRVSGEEEAAAQCALLWGRYVSVLENRRLSSSRVGFVTPRRFTVRRFVCVYLCVFCVFISYCVSVVLL